VQSRMVMEFVGTDFTHDLFTCSGRRTSWTDMSQGLPPYPTPLPLVNQWRYDVSSSDVGLQYCTYDVEFPDQRDPLIHSAVHQSMEFMERPRVAHLRWHSADWWCQHPSVLAMHPVRLEHPKHSCRMLPSSQH
jgi:hypothetical protein